MPILKFRDALLREVELSHITKEELCQGLLTALLELDPSIKESVKNKIWRDDFNYLTPYWADVDKEV